MDFLLQTHVLTYTVVAIALLLGYSVNCIFQKYESDFSGVRVKRTCKESPSNKQCPSITEFEFSQARIVARSERHASFAKCELIADVKQKRKKVFENKIVQEQAKALPFKGALETNEAAAKLDMNHVYMRFVDFLWGYIFLGPMSYIMMKKGTMTLSIRQYLLKKGILKVREPDIEALIASLCLEQSQVIHYFAKTQEGSKLGNVAGFFFSDFPYIDNNCEYRVADLFAVDIDLDTKRFVKAKMDNTDLTAQETLILLWFNTVATHHVKLHAMANWSVNDDLSLDKLNPVLRQNSLVTTMYNFFRYSTFQKSLKTWEKQGLLSKGFSEKDALMKCINHGLRAGLGHHEEIAELIDNSKLVNFTVKVRTIFMDEFAKHKHMFPGIDGEAFFVGTVLHSLDHTLMEWNMTDPLWLDVNNEKFGKTAELGRILRATSVDDPSLAFNRRFRGSKHPFYRSVYEKAAKIDKELADHMDTCIVK